MDNDEFFVPALTDTSDFGAIGFRRENDEAAAAGSSKNYDEIYWRRRAELAAATTSNENMADLTVESLMDLPLTGRSLPPSDLGSKRDDLFDGLRAMRNRINRLEQNQYNSRRNISDLKNATDTYTKLLERIPAGKDICTTEYNISGTVDLLDDKDIVPIYDRLHSRLTILEARKRLTSGEHSGQDFQALFTNNGQQQSSSGTLSDIEKARAGGGGGSFEKFKDLFDLDTVPLPHVDYSNKAPAQVFPQDGDGRFKQPASIPLDRISNKSSNGSSRSLKIDNIQRDRLNSFAEKLRTNDILPAASSSPKIPRHVSLLNKSIQCQVCHLDKSTQCVCSTSAINRPNFHDKWTSVSYFEKPFSLRDDANDDVIVNIDRKFGEENGGYLNQDELHKELLSLKRAAEEQNRQKTKKEINDATKRPSSAPLSPVRKLQKPNADDKKPAFVAGKSTETSYSVVVNLQELLSVLKRQNPALHQICLKLGSHVSLVTLADAFEKEIKTLNRKAHVNLIQKLKLFEELSKEIQSCNNPTEKSDLEQRQHGLVGEIEQLDTYVQRLNSQSATLVKLRKTAEVEIACKSNRICKSYARTASRSVSPPANPNMYSNNLTKHTVASRQKALDEKPPKQTSSSHFNHKFSVQFLKDIKTAKSILNTN